MPRLLKLAGIILAVLPFIAIQTGRLHAIADCTIFLELNTATASAGGFNPDTDGVHVVYELSDGSDLEIYLYNISTGITTQVTNNSAYDDFPLVEGDYVIWQGGNAQGWAEIWAYKISTGQITNLSNTAVGNESEATISGRYVAWTNGNLSIYDLQTMQLVRTIPLTDYDREPQLDGNYLIWRNYNTSTGFSRIKLHNIVTNTTTELTAGELVYDFMLNGDYAVWNASDGTDAEIYLYRISTQTTSTLTNNVDYDKAPAIHGNTVVWINEIVITPPNDQVWDAYRYQIDTGITTNLTGNTAYEYYIQPGDAYLAWAVKQTSGDDYEVVIYDQADAVVTPLTDNTWAESDLQLVGNILLWKRIESGQVWLVVAECGEAEPTSTANPTEAPTILPTDVPTSTPTEVPTEAPSEAPTAVASLTPTEPPTEFPTEPLTEAPTDAPTEAPTEVATLEATEVSTTIPTAFLTDIPTNNPAETATELPTEAPTAGSTSAATSTPTDLPTIIPTGSATETATEQATGVPASATPTDTEFELLTNGGFETGITGWTVSGGSSDKVRCNGAKIIAHEGDCAFVFKGGPGENSRLTPIITASGVETGDRLQFQLFYRGKGGAVNGTVKLRVKYAGATPTGKLNAALIASDGYVEVLETIEFASAEVSKIKLQISHRSASGKLYVDAVSLLHLPATGATIPLP